MKKKTKRPDQSEKTKKQKAGPKKTKRAPVRAAKKPRKAATMALAKAAATKADAPTGETIAPFEPFHVGLFTDMGTVMERAREAIYRALCETVACCEATVREAFKKHGVSWGAFHTCLRHYKGLRDIWDDALAARGLMDRLDMQDAARAHMIDGVEVPICQQGVIVTHKKVYADGLLASRLQAADLREMGGKGGTMLGGNANFTIISHIPEPKMDAGEEDGDQ